MGYGFGPSTDTDPLKDKSGKHDFSGPVHGGHGYYTVTCPYCGKTFRPQSSPLKGPGAGSSPGFSPWWNRPRNEKKE